MQTTANAVIASKTKTVEEKLHGGLGGALIRTHSQDSSQLPEPYVLLKDYSKGEDRQALQQHLDDFCEAEGLPPAIVTPRMRDQFINGKFNVGTLGRWEDRLLSTCHWPRTSKPTLR